MTYRELIDKITEFAKETPNIGEVWYGDIYSANEKRTYSLPIIAIVPQQDIYDINANRMTYNIQLCMCDLLNEDKTNKLSIHSACETALAVICKKLAKIKEIIGVDVTFDKYNIELNDLCSGVVANLNIRAEYLMCDYI